MKEYSISPSVNMNEILQEGHKPMEAQATLPVAGGAT